MAASAMLALPTCHWRLEVGVSDGTPILHTGALGPPDHSVLLALDYRGAVIVVTAVLVLVTVMLWLHWREWF